MDVLVLLLTDIFKSAFLHFNLKRYFGAKRHIAVIVACWCLDYLIVDRVTQYHNATFNLIAGLITTMAVIVYAYKGTVRQKVFVSIIIVAFMMLSEVAVGVFYANLIHMDLQSVIDNRRTYVICYITSRVLGLILISILFYISKKNEREEISRLEWALDFLIPSISIVVIHNIIMSNIDATLTVLDAVAIVGILLINYIILYIYDLMQKAAVRERENALLLQQEHSYVQYCEEARVADENLKKLRHDMRNHVQVLYSCLVNKQYDDLEDYMLELIGGYVDSKKNVMTGNSYIDTMLNTKIHVAESKDIHVEWSVDIPFNIKLKPQDCCALFGNILDNAIEAAEKVEGERFIKIKVIYDMPNMFIKVCNSFSEPLIKDKKNRYITTKKDKQNHGMGLQAIRAVAQKYNGDILIEEKEKEFEVSVLLYNV